jgi:hypothetical protein
LSVGNDKHDVEYHNVEAADNVLKRFGMPTHMPRYERHVLLGNQPDSLTNNYGHN